MKTPGTAFSRLGIVLGLVVALGSYASASFKNAGEWMPPIPNSIGIWEGVDTPIPRDVLEKLGGPQGEAREYHNPFGEAVSASVITAGAFENYHDPTVCVTGGGFALTGKKIFPLDGPGSGNVRAMIFRNDSTPYGTVRIVMYYWQQNRDGTTATEAVMGNYRDTTSRFKTGYGAIVKRNQTVLMRVYAVVAPDDVDGQQAQRNVGEISRVLYQSLKKNGREAGTN